MADVKLVKFKSIISHSTFYAKATYTTYEFGYIFQSAWATGCQLVVKYFAGCEAVALTQCSVRTGPRGGRVSGAGQQILPGPGRGGCGEHHESHQYQELLGRHQSHHPADAVPQQGTVLCADNATVLNKLSITYIIVAFLDIIKLFLKYWDSF